MRRVYLSLSESYPFRAIFLRVWDNLRRLVVPTHVQGRPQRQKLIQRAEPSSPGFGISPSISEEHLVGIDDNSNLFQRDPLDGNNQANSGFALPSIGMML